jgi:hypothetical protein
MYVLRLSTVLGNQHAQACARLKAERRTPACQTHPSPSPVFDSRSVHILKAIVHVHVAFCLTVFFVERCDAV